MGDAAGLAVWQPCSILSGMFRSSRAVLDPAGRYLSEFSPRRPRRATHAPIHGGGIYGPGWSHQCSGSEIEQLKRKAESERLALHEAASHTTPHYVPLVAPLVETSVEELLGYGVSRIPLAEGDHICASVIVFAHGRRVVRIERFDRDGVARGGDLFAIGETTTDTDRALVREALFDQMVRAISATMGPAGGPE